MAKKSMIARERKRERTVAKYEERRKALKAIIGDRSKPLEEVMSASFDLQKLPRNASPVRLRTRCGQTGRPRAVYRRFGLGRTKLREAAMRGDVPGLVKSSW
ncbi:MAG: 30S ribosomal protein S14 [Gammaproteobacteria bacterium]|nr:30S ribosomal protein S14 [Gammaproteobacteria bacterium]MCY4200295.1 30S ribosomal protein S14 [Gammaproteobacteria bacterium]MCY4278544.1 30S ribosomal protein S14 [Gammaproteobacteria bacterium]MCY4323181.1 30S ribosomal protein S14 [Gammaproteobacteria bacterium]